MKIENITGKRLQDRIPDVGRRKLEGTEGSQG
jgi:hypothetical protein